MIDDPEEPLEGDIGPASTGRPADTPGAAEGPGATSADAVRERRREFERYERERDERRRRANAMSGRIALAMASVLLAFLTYDSVSTAVEAHAKGDDWIYPPAVIAGVCATALVVVLVWALRRRPRG
ncbi:hypothetical protein [Actinomadura rubrisoli]|uniref:Uncharacterized protein n=1 Tax=Actinomadura rubrisoli TaxID=2530368 RepID=A0A4R5BCY5_9ACTN|nr:hypothetical protein [Actinomadura rubrisoli]TDD83123.1 hypothetical protein E1298_21715 [Actinomadura rubrisoli]